MESSLRSDLEKVGVIASDHFENFGFASGVDRCAGGFGESETGEGDVLLMAGDAVLLAAVAEIRVFGEGGSFFERRDRSAKCGAQSLIGNLDGAWFGGGNRFESFRGSAGFLERGGDGIVIAFLGDEERGLRDAHEGIDRRSAFGIWICTVLEEGLDELWIGTFGTGGPMERSEFVHF